MEREEILDGQQVSHDAEEDAKKVCALNPFRQQKARGALAEFTAIVT